MDTVKLPEIVTKHPVEQHGQLIAQSALADSISCRAERTLVWKFDLRILPVLAIMYLFNSLDKSNLGNFKTAGLQGMCALNRVLTHLSNLLQIY